METAAGCVSIDIEPDVPLIFGSGHMALSQLLSVWPGLESLLAARKYCKSL